MKRSRSPLLDAARLSAYFDGVRSNKTHAADEGWPVSTPIEIARWMLAEIEESHWLLQVEVVAEIAKRFGPDYVYIGDYGEKSIDRRILYLFRRVEARL